MLDYAPPAIVAQATPAPSAEPTAFGALHVAVDDAALRGLPEHTITAIDERGRSATYTGVDIHDLLVREGAPSGKALHGRAMRIVVVIGAADAYHVVFSLSELDPGFTDREALIAQRRDGTLLPSSEGPYRLIVPGDKREARWVRQVITLDVEEAP